MSKKSLLTIALALVSTTAFAQDNEIPRNDVSVSAGAAVPTGNNGYLKTAPMISLLYGRRFNHFFQAEGGLQMAFGAANNQNVEVSDFGSVMGGDHEFMIPFSGRFYVPIHLQKWQVSAGGGAAYLHYGETASTDVSTYCYTCTSRGGWGLQGFATARYFVGDNFYVGTTLQYVTATLNGDAVGNVPATRTHDHWSNVLFGIGMTF